MSWNSNRWSDRATREDIAHSNFDYVKKNSRMHEDLNFGHELYPCEEDGMYIGYSPMFNKLPSAAHTKYTDFVFFKSFDHHTHSSFIVGFYAWPRIGNFERRANHRYFTDYDWGNVKSLPAHIVLFDNPLPVNNEIALKEGYLPKGKELGLMGFNYLTYNNVIRILDKASRLNPGQKKLSTIKLKFLKETQGVKLVS